ncbi:uncharacterized protein B0I36DRAFT_347860 [Microdochium trichocladiopsis]|uniref:Cyanovirin-N domain-containing protein n=1 Tax=Microdochium trichocladiopsis TaxID=1682393 RepID=A0A9P9BP22_9PEZI|nr:uncharacterized protein B0I36DRAFT_347860 [Microdochium trichocladiopsis]KAH7032679.1 hypothetical protein B0I36DRAFT_347860 [Microdochium trichocladiopsis]
MVTFASSISVVFGLLALASAAPSLQGRDVSCRDDLGAPDFGHASEAVECINYLAGLGNQACVSSISGVNFCRRGSTQITGLSKTGKNGATSSCANVARAAGAIMDRCTRQAADGVLFVKGSNEAWGNGDLLVDIRKV